MNEWKVENLLTNKQFNYHFKYVSYNHIKIIK